MPPLHLTTLQLKLDDWRVRQHFKRVERILRDRDVSHLPPALQQAREQHLNRLHAYAARSIFPRNHERPVYAPCFIDRDGRECAVAHLMMTSGHSDAAHIIASVANYAYVPQMAFAELDDWAAQTGFTSDELALIQPGYYLAFEGWYVWVGLVAWAAGLLIILINSVQISRKRIGIIAPAIGFAILPFLLVLTISYSCDWSAAYTLGKNPDGRPSPVALNDAGPLGLALLITLGIGIVTFGLSVSRTEAFIRTRRTAKQAALDSDTPSQS